VGYFNAQIQHFLGDICTCCTIKIIYNIDELCMEEKARNAHKILVEKPKLNRPLETQDRAVIAQSV
jgi:hypothetical protein